MPQRAHAVALLLVVAAGAQASTDLPFFGRATFGITAAAQAVDVRRNGETHPYRFEEHFETAEGFTLDELTFDATNEQRRSFLRIRARDAGERDQQFAAEAGVADAWRVKAFFDGFPRLFTTTARSPYSYLGHGRMAMDEAMRRELEMAGEETLQFSARRIATQAPLARIAFQRNRIGGRARWAVLEWLDVRASARDEMRNGTRPFSIGAFDQVGPASAPQFAVLLFEFAEPIEIRTNEFSFGATILRPAWRVDVDATTSRFRNTITDIDYDNPFRVTDAAAAPDGLTNRMRAARGIATSAPDSAAQTIRASAEADLGSHARIGGAVTWSRMRQDQRFAPWTLNHAIRGSGLPAGLGPVNIEALPRPALHGRTTAVTTDDSLAILLTGDLTLTLRYRDHELSHTTPDLAMPGYAGGGDAFWRIEFGGEPIVALPYAYRRQSSQAELVWKIGGFRTRVSHEREIWTREHRQMSRTEQDALTAAVHYRRPELSGAFTLRHARRAGNTTPVRFEARNRSQTRATLRAQWAPSDRLGFAAAVNALSDDYRMGIAGLDHFAAHDATIDVRVALFTTSELTARVTRQSIRYEYAQVTPADRWTRDVDDHSTSTALEYDATFGRFWVHAGYERQSTSQSFVTRGAVDGERPDVSADLQQIRGDLEYELTPRWKVGLRYRYEPFTLDDYATNGLSPYPLDVISPEVDARRVFLLDARYADHEAHVLALYLRLVSD